jgi:hypothetical protein
LLRARLATAFVRMIQGTSALMLPPHVHTLVVPAFRPPQGTFDVHCRRGDVRRSVVCAHGLRRWQLVGAAQRANADADATFTSTSAVTATSTTCRRA